VQVAYLALKHRRNKMGGQRIVLLVGSPVEDDPKTLKKVAGILRKNGVRNPQLFALASENPLDPLLFPARLRWT
jgi:hypothetical protein